MREIVDIKKALLLLIVVIVGCSSGGPVGVGLEVVDSGVVVEDLAFSLPGGTFVDPFLLGLLPSSPDARVYYTLNGQPPSEFEGVDTLYAEPIPISETTWVRARVFEPNSEAGSIVSQVYVAVEENLATFDSNLPLVVISASEFGIDFGGSGYQSVSAVFIDTDDLGRASLLGPADFAGHAGIRVRGNTSAEYDKKQYAFETWDEHNRDLKVSLLGFPEESDWIIHAPYSDKTLMRNHLIFTWSNLIGRYAARTRLAELFVATRSGKVSQSNYRGVYVFTERVKRDRNRVSIQRMTPEHNSEPEISGGYLLKKDWWDEDQPRNWLSTKMYRDVLLYVDPEPDEITREQKEWLRDYLDSFEMALIGPEFADPNTGYAQYIDVDSFIDHHILVEVSRNVDGYVLSTFLSKDRDGKLGMGPIWDYNGSLGGADYFCSFQEEGWHYEFDSAECGDAYYRETFPADNPTGYRWYQRLFDDPEFLLKYADRWFDLREGTFSTASMIQDIDNNVALLTDNGATDNPVTRNFDRWPILGHYIWPNYLDELPSSTFEGHVTWMKAWVSGRLTWMDGAISIEYGARPPIYRVNGSAKDNGGNVDPGSSLSIVLPDGASGTVYYTIDGTDPRLRGGDIAPGAKTFEEPITLDRSTRIKARTYDGNNWSALNEAVFSAGPVADSLRISEIMYHPPGPEAEFVELRNIGNEQIDLSMVQFTEGISYTFPSIWLAPEAHVLVIKNQTVFDTQYPGFRGEIAGVYDRRLSNRGEAITLSDATGQVIHSVDYRDGWYNMTDGDGYSLTIRDPTSVDTSAWGSKIGWRPSAAVGGSPGWDDSGMFIDLPMGRVD